MNKIELLDSAAMQVMLLRVKRFREPGALPREHRPTWGQQGATGSKDGRSGASGSHVSSNSPKFLPDLLSSFLRGLSSTKALVPRPGWLSKAWRFVPAMSPSLGLRTSCVEPEPILKDKVTSWCRPPLGILRKFCETGRPYHQISP
jgi:hypothetical protein